MALLRNDETDVNELILAIGLLIRKIRSEAPSEVSELSLTQKAVLVRLEKDGPATIADLARSENVKPQSMGTAVAGLEEAGMILRKPHPTDGRQINIEISAKAAAMRKTNKAAKRTWLAQAIAKLSKADQAKLFEAGEIIKHLAEL